MMPLPFKHSYLGYLKSKSIGEISQSGLTGCPFLLDHHSAIMISRRVLFDTLKIPATHMRGLSALKTRYRPLVCPLHKVLGEIPSGVQLFDIGCGTGTLLYLALTLRSVQVAHGYDISHSAVAASSAFKANSARFQIFLLPVQETPPRLDTYDVVTMIDVLHHIPRKQQDDFLHNVVNRMNRGAKFIFVDINASDRIGTLFNQMHDLIFSHQWVHARRPSDVMSVMELSGLRVSKHIYLRSFLFPHHMVIGYKI
jgi:2-polyprenyl-3-methyl-5-hydroxy-6-metoxy-1,4-benzoquinol methylase